MVLKYLVLVIFVSWFLLVLISCLEAATTMSKEAEVMEAEVMMFLSELEADELEVVCSKIPLTCPETAQGKKNALLKLLFKHLLSLDDKEDKGFATYQIIHTHVTELKKPDSDSKEKVELDVKKVKSDSSEKSKTWVEIQKLKDFKISGTIGGVVEKDKLSYTSLSYQIANGRKLGVPEERICAAVIKAISPSNNLRTYLESKPNLTLVSMIEILRSHFKEKDSASVFTELSNAVQQVTETALDFVLRLMCLRQKILDLSNEEGCPYDETLLGKRFFHTIFTGMRNANIRVELREKCKNDPKISDEELLKFVSEVVANESERNEKLSTKKSTVNAVEVNKKFENIDSSFSLSPQSLKEKKKDNPFVKIEELKLTQGKEIAAMRAELSELRTALQANPSSHLPQQTFPNANFMKTNQIVGVRSKYRPRGNTNFKRKKCSGCENNNIPRCFHCFFCGSAEHFMYGCPQKNV